jgi:DNA-binding response OmpR family regulator
MGATVMSDALLEQPYAHIRLLFGNDPTSEIELRNDVCTIGRSSTCHIVIDTKTKIVSRLHAKIERNGLRYVLYDAGSANHTFINGQQIVEAHVLSHLDQIGLGMPQPLLEFLDPDPTIVVRRRLRYDERTKLFYLNEHMLDLTPSQFRLLSHLYQHIGQICTHTSCAQAIWGPDYEPGLDADALHRIVNVLRKKLRNLDDSADLIQTRRELGYLLDL